MPNPEFLVSSRNPGIGSDWWDKYGHIDVLPHGRVITTQGTPAPVPRYYKNKVTVPHMRFTKDKLALEAITTKRVYDTMPKRKLEDTPQRRAARTTYANARTSLFKRDTRD